MTDQEMLRKKQEMLRLTIIAQDKTMTEALLMLEQAYTAAHHGDLLGCLPYIAQAMEILASDDYEIILATIEVGDVVLIGKHDPFWAGCLLHVETVKSWGVTGTIRGPNATDYPLRVALENITTVFRERR